MNSIIRLVNSNPKGGKNIVEMHIYHNSRIAHTKNKLRAFVCKNCKSLVCVIRICEKANKCVKCERKKIRLKNNNCEICNNIISYCMCWICGKIIKKCGNYNNEICKNYEITKTISFRPYFIIQCKNCP